jgi:hypothetical protein
MTGDVMSRTERRGTILGDLLRSIRVLTARQWGDGQCASRPARVDGNGGCRRADGPEHPQRCGDANQPACVAHPPALRSSDGDIRLLSGLEEVVAAMRRGADELERWGRRADMDRIEKVRRLAMLVGGLNHQLAAEVVTAVASLADIERSRLDRQAQEAVPDPTQTAMNGDTVGSACASE